MLEKLVSRLRFKKYKKLDSMFQKLKVQFEDWSSKRFYRTIYKFQDQKAQYNVLKTKTEPNFLDNQNLNRRLSLK